VSIIVIHVTYTCYIHLPGADAGLDAEADTDADTGADAQSFFHLVSRSFAKKPSFSPFSVFFAAVTAGPILVALKRDAFMDTWWV
jgi:hypothetical protein